MIVIAQRRKHDNNKKRPNEHIFPCLENGTLYIHFLEWFSSSRLIKLEIDYFIVNKNVAFFTPKMIIILNYYAFECHLKWYWKFLSWIFDSWIKVYWNLHLIIYEFLSFYSMLCCCWSCNTTCNDNILYGRIMRIISLRLIRYITRLITESVHTKWLIQVVITIRDPEGSIVKPSIQTIFFWNEGWVLIKRVFKSSFSHCFRYWNAIWNKWRSIQLNGLKKWPILKITYFLIYSWSDSSMSQITFDRSQRFLLIASKIVGSLCRFLREKFFLPEKIEKGQWL